jgi:hypothetical protein
MACEGHRQGITDSWGNAGWRRVGSIRCVGSWHEAASIARLRRLGVVVPLHRKRRGTESVESCRAETIAVGGLLDHLHHIAAIQSRLSDVRQLVVLDAGPLVICPAVRLGNIVVECHVRIPSASVPVHRRCSWAACLWGFQSLEDRQNVTKCSGHVQRKFERSGLLTGSESS